SRETGGRAGEEKGDAVGGERGERHVVTGGDDGIGARGLAVPRAARDNDVAAVTLVEEEQALPRQTERCRDRGAVHLHGVIRGPVDRPAAEVQLVKRRRSAVGSTGGEGEPDSPP